MKIQMLCEFTLVTAVVLSVGCGSTVNPGNDVDADPVDGVAVDVPVADEESLDGDSAQVDAYHDVDVKMDDALDVVDATVDAIDAGVDAIDAGVDAGVCMAALHLGCGDSLNHSTTVQGRPDEWNGYACTARLESGREVVYELKTDGNCRATVRLTNITDDIDLFHLQECDPWTCNLASSTPVDIQDGEEIAFNTRAGVGELVVVDGYDTAGGDYTVTVDCECPEPSATYKAALAECAYQFGDNTGDTPPVPDVMPCLDTPCKADDDCPVMDSMNLGGQCVTGNCVYCWQDSQCPELSVCRGGRCVSRGVAPCPAPPSCDQIGCRLVEISEAVCSVCVCDTEIDDPCSVDIDCQPMAHHFFQHCVYGRCAECRNDAECTTGLQCLPPGVCDIKQDHPSLLYGAWLIGWWGDLNHYSYFRFEPDGTLRRSAYESDGIWMDDIFLGGCYMDPETRPDLLIGTWQPEMTESMFLAIRIDFKALCAGGADWRERFLVQFDDDGPGITLKSIDHDGAMDLTGMRIAPGWCEADFSTCPLPEYPL